MKRLTALPRISDSDITELRREYRQLKDKHHDTRAIYRRLKLVVARQIRREVREAS